MEAHTFSRLVAFLVDIIILAVLLSLLTFWIPTSKKYEDAVKYEKELSDKYSSGDINSKDFMNEYFANHYTKDKESEVISIVSVILSLGYFGTFAFYRNGQTLGKSLMKIKIVSEDGSQPKQMNFIVRALIINGVFTSLLSCIIILFINKNQYIYTIGLLQVIQTVILVVSLLMIAFRQDKKGLHDIITKTKVINSD